MQPGANRVGNVKERNDTEHREKMEGYVGNGSYRRWYESGKKQ